MQQHRAVQVGLWLFMCAQGVLGDPLVFKTGSLSVTVDDRGSITQLMDSRAGTNYLAPGQPAPLLSLRSGNELVRPDRMEWDSTNSTMTLHFDTIRCRVGVRASAKETHLVLTLESIQPQDKADLAIWGPYPTTIGATIGETVGVVRNSKFALGIQALNMKTLGGYPNTEDDVMPSYEFFPGSNLADIVPGTREKELFRGDTAKPTPFGSVLQAFCRDRSKERIIANWGHTHYVAPPFQDGGLTGARIALFGCPASKALETLGKIEVAEGLPHPLIDGVWGKLSPDATASYLIIDFGEKNLDAALRLTRQAGLKYLYHGGPFRTWGHFDLQPNAFPDGWLSLKRCVERAREQGVRLGVHTLSNFIGLNDPYVTPVPDPRLARVGTSRLEQDLSVSETEIQVAEPIWFNQMKNNTLKTAVIGEELIRYGSVSSVKPWRLLNCQRGAWGTRAANHRKGEAVGKLMDHGYRVFLTNADLSREVAERIADLFSQTGLRQISFDGLEGNWSTGMGQYGRTLFTKAWFDRLSPELRGQVINDASNPGHFTWHIYTRMNWGEPWYAGFRESQTQYRLKNQSYYQRNLMPHMLGWFQMNANTSREDAEWLLARAAGFDAGFCLVTGPETVQKNGLGQTILESIKQWETARLAGAFPNRLKPDLQDIHREFQLSALASNAWNLAPVYSLKLTHDRKEQPGMLTTQTAGLEQPFAAQPLQFILQAAGKTQADGIVLEINGVEALSLNEPLGEGQILKYVGGNTAIRYDSQWQRLGTLPVDPGRLRVARGKSAVAVSCRFSGADKPALKCDLRTVGEPERIKAQ